MTVAGHAHQPAAARRGGSQDIRFPAPVVVSTILLLWYAVAMAVGGIGLIVAGPESADLSVDGHAVSVGLFGLVLSGLALVWVVVTALAAAGRRGARVALAVLGMLVVPAEGTVALHYLGVPSSSYWWIGVAGSLHVPLVVAGVALLFLPASSTRKGGREGEVRRLGTVPRRGGELPLAILFLAYETVNVAVATYAMTVRPRPQSADVITIAGLALGVIGLVYLKITVAVLLGRDRVRADPGMPMTQGPPEKGADGPPGSVASVVVLLAFAAAATGVGMCALLNGTWEDIGGLVALAGLLVWVIGLGYLVLTVPIMLGRRRADSGLAQFTVLLVACGACVVATGGTELGAMSLYLALLLPVSAVLLLLLPAWRPLRGRSAAPTH